MSQIETPRDEFDDQVDEQLDDDFDDEEETFDCHGHFEDGPGQGAFVCGAAGSEDCDFECPYSRDLGLTLKQISEREDSEPEASTP